MQTDPITIPGEQHFYVVDQKVLDGKEWKPHKGASEEPLARLGIEGYEAAKWIVQDYGDIVVHVFDKETRDYYELEELWADARKLDWEL